MRNRQARAAIVTRRSSTPSSFYQWALHHETVEAEPVYRADQPKRLPRIPVWLEWEEQARFETTLKDGAISRSTSSATTCRA